MFGARLAGQRDPSKLFDASGWSFCDTVQGCCRTDFYRGFAQITDAFVKMEDELLAETGRMIDALEMPAVCSSR